MAQVQKQIEFDDTVRMSMFSSPKFWRNIIITAIVLLGGSGGLAAFDLVGKGDVKECIEDALTTERMKADLRFGQIDTVIQKQRVELAEINSNVKDIRMMLGRDVARQEARRLTESIKNRRERENAYDRLLDRNLRRLESGKDPCLTIACDR